MQDIRTEAITIWTDPALPAFGAYFTALQLRLNAHWEAGDRLTAVLAVEANGEVYELLMQWDIGAEIPAVNPNGITLHGSPFLANGVGASQNLVTGNLEEVQNGYEAFVVILQSAHTSSRVCRVAQLP